MKKNIKLYVIAVISVVFLGALVVHFDDIREYKQECEDTWMMRMRQELKECRAF